MSAFISMVEYHWGEYPDLTESDQIKNEELDCDWED